MTEDESHLQSERQFLHDAANVLAIAQGHLYLLQRQLEASPDFGQTPDIKKRLETIVSSFVRLATMMRDRRESL